MEKFRVVERGYDPVEVNDFLDKVIGRFEEVVKELNDKNQIITSLKKERIDLLQNKDASLLKEENRKLTEALGHYKNMEETLNRAILMAQRTSDQMKVSASDQALVIVSEAKNNASRIINEALLKSEKITSESDLLRRNLVVFKKRLRGVLETQLELVEDIEKVDL